jgi:hypothetical protein
LYSKQPGEKKKKYIREIKVNPFYLDEKGDEKEKTKDEIKKEEQKIRVKILKKSKKRFTKHYMSIIAYRLRGALKLLRMYKREDRKQQEVEIRKKQFDSIMGRHEV